MLRSWRKFRNSTLRLRTPRAFHASTVSPCCMNKATRQVKTVMMMDLVSHRHDGRKDPLVPCEDVTYFDVFQEIEVPRLDG